MSDNNLLSSIRSTEKHKEKNHNINSYMDYTNSKQIHKLTQLYNILKRDRLYMDYEKSAKFQGAYVAAPTRGLHNPQ